MLKTSKETKKEGPKVFLSNKEDFIKSLSYFEQGERIEFKADTGYWIEGILTSWKYEEILIGTPAFYKIAEKFFAHSIRKCSPKLTKKEEALIAQIEGIFCRLIKGEPGNVNEIRNHLEAIKNGWTLDDREGN